MNILYIVTGLGMGGAEIITVDIANQMQERGHNVMLLYLTGENMQSHRITPLVVVKGLKMEKNPLSLLKCLFKARKIVNGWHPDVVHSNMIHSNIFARLLRVICNFSFLISTEHNKNIEGGIRMCLYRMTDFLSDLNTNVSQEATNYFIEKKAFSKNKSVTIYNGVDISKFKVNKVNAGRIRKQYGFADSDFVFLNVGRLMPAKNHKILVDAFKILFKRYKNIKLLIVGDGVLRSELIKQIESVGLQNHIILAGIHNNIVDYYNSADCFVLSSVWEGFPMVLIEAMACSVPIVTTECGREAVGDDNYVAPIQDVCTLSKMMEAIYSMPLKDRIALGEKNRIRAEKFDLQHVCDQWLQIYNGKK